MGKQGEFRFDDDLGALLHFSDLFNTVISCARSETEDSLIEAQRKFIAGLCVLAGKIEQKIENLNINRVLGIWDIPNNVL